MIRRQLEASLKENDALRQRAVHAERNRGPSEETLRQAEEARTQAEQRVAQLRNDNEVLRNRVSQLTAKYTSVDPEVLGEAQQEVERLKTQLEEVKRAASEFKKTSEENAAVHKSKMVDLLSKFKSLKTTHDQTKADLQASDSKASGLEEQRSSFEQRVAHLEEELSAARQTANNAAAAAFVASNSANTSAAPVLAPGQEILGADELKAMRAKAAALSKLSEAFKSVKRRANTLQTQRNMLLERLGETEESMFGADQAAGEEGWCWCCRRRTERFF